MGLIVSVYKCGFDCTGGGLSANVDALTLVNVEGPFEPTADRPAALLVEGYAPGTLRIVPDGRPGERPMMGGNYAATADSRFAKACRAILGTEFYGAVAIHDRYEG